MKIFYYISTLLVTIFVTSCHQMNTLNLDFEDINDGLPRNWLIHNPQTDFSVCIDSVNVLSGKYSIVMEFTGDIIDYHAFTYKLPYHSEGREITLSGSIKTECVTDGFASLWLMVDSNSVWRPYEISFMEQNGLTGTNDWRKCEITLDMHPSEGNTIEIGGLLSGKGKMWLDDLKVTIDGESVEKAVLYQPKVFLAKKDRGSDISSDIIFPELSKQKIDDLELLGRIWGFLKYHHPEIAKGNYNWDYELFRILSTFLNVTDNRHRDQVLIEWIDKYGGITKSNICKSMPDNVFLKPDLFWIENSGISWELRKVLYEIYENRNQGFQYYIKMYPYIGNPIFLNEEAYMGPKHFPNTRLRLLSLFRFWNIINYFFPYKYMTDKDWNTILKEYIPGFVNAENRLEYELIFAQLLGEVGDSHARLQEGGEKIEELKGSRQIPIIVKFIENQLVVIEAENVELARGDIITHIEGKSVEVIVDNIKRYYPASNETVRMNDIAKDILRSNKYYIQIEYISSGGIIKHGLLNTENRKKWLYDFQNKKNVNHGYKFISNNIGYIDLRAITKEDIPIIKNKFFNTKGIIVDNRSLPSDIFQMLASYFVSRTTIFSKQTLGNLNNPGEFRFSSAYKIPLSKEFYDGILIVLVNEETISNAEYATMAFQVGENTTVIGSQTGGFDGNISKIVLPGGLITYISGNGVYYPDGKETQRIGIMPDIEVKPSIKGIREGRDEVLEKAIEFIEQK